MPNEFAHLFLSSLFLSCLFKAYMYLVMLIDGDVCEHVETWHVVRK